MDSMSGAGRARELRSGGKMVRPRRAAGARTPYDRPGLPNSVQRNPNWVSRFIYSPSRTIATGAGKLLASVFVSDSSSSSSSSSSSGSSGNISDDDLDVNNEVNGSYCLRDETMHKNSAAPEMIKSFENVPELVTWRKETKHVIEQLLLQETFSREERDRLTDIIKSRVVDHPNMADAKDGRLHEVPKDVEVPDISSKAVIEARKWLEEKKSGSLDHGSYTLNCVTECEVGSPVYMAKSYMRTRPPWASPSVDHIEHRSPSSIGMQHFQKETPFSVGGTSISSSKLKYGSVSAGSWNIQEELRRVRSKATDEMLKNLSSSKNVCSPFSSAEHNDRTDFLVVDKLQTVTHNVEGKFQNETLANQAPSSSQCNQYMEADQAVEETQGAPTEAGRFVLALKATPDSKAHLQNNSTSKEVAGAGGVVTSNGFPSSEPSFSVRFDAEPEPRPSAEENDPITSRHYKDTRTAHVEASREVFGEASTDVPIVNEEDSVTQNSCSLHQELLEDCTQPIEKLSTGKVGRGKGRGRGRGRGRGKQ